MSSKDQDLHSVLMRVHAGSAGRCLPLPSPSLSSLYPCILHGCRKTSEQAQHDHQPNKEEDPETGADNAIIVLWLSSHYPLHAEFRIL